MPDTGWMQAGWQKQEVESERHRSSVLVFRGRGGREGGKNVNKTNSNDEIQTSSTLFFFLVLGITLASVPEEDLDCNRLLNYFLPG